MPATPKNLRTKDPAKLREVAQADRRKLTEAKKELRELEADLAHAEGPQVGRALRRAVASQVGAAAHGVARGYLGRRKVLGIDYEPLAGGAGVLAGWWLESEDLIAASSGFAARWTSESIEGAIERAKQAKKDADARKLMDEIEAEAAEREPVKVVR